MKKSPRCWLCWLLEWLTEPAYRLRWWGLYNWLSITSYHMDRDECGVWHTYETSDDLFADMRKDSR